MEEELKKEEKPKSATLPFAVSNLKEENKE